MCVCACIDSISKSGEMPGEIVVETEGSPRIEDAGPQDKAPVVNGANVETLPRHSGKQVWEGRPATRLHFTLSLSPLLKSLSPSSLHFLMTFVNITVGYRFASTPCALHVFRSHIVLFLSIL